MRNRFINLFIREAQFGLRLIIICVLIVSALYARKNARADGRRLEKLKEEKRLAEQVPRMEEKLKMLELNRQKAVTVQKTEKMSVIIHGVVIQNNVPLVLIGEDLFAEGDSRDGYSIYKITLDSVILEDKATKSQHTIILSPLVK